MRITVQATGETLDRGNSKEERAKARNLICRIVNPRNTKASSQRAREFGFQEKLAASRNRAVPA